MSAKSKVYQIICNVPSTALTTVMGVLEGAAEIVKIEPIEAKAPRAAPRYANGRRAKGITGPDLVVQVLKAHKRPVTVSEMRAAFKARGFAETSWSPSVNRLGKKVARGVDGSLSLAK